MTDFGLATLLNDLANLYNDIGTIYVAVII
jgi:hypothetical protein